MALTNPKMVAKTIEPISILELIDRDFNWQVEPDFWVLPGQVVEIEYLGNGVCYVRFYHPIYTPDDWLLSKSVIASEKLELIY